MLTQDELRIGGQYKTREGLKVELLGWLPESEVFVGRVYYGDRLGEYYEAEWQTNGKCVVWDLTLATSVPDIVG